MKRAENNNWLNEALAKAIGSEKSGPDFDKWKRDHPEAVETLTSRPSRQFSAATRLLSVTSVIVKSPITKLAAAGLVVVTVLLGLNMIGNGGNALADVLDKVNEVRASAYRVKIRAGQHGGSIGKQDDLIWEMHVLESRDYGRRIYWYWVKGPECIPVKTTEPYSKVYILASEAMMVSVRLDQKKFWRTRLTDGLWDWEKRQESRIFLKGFTNRPYTRLGRDRIDGITVEGYESTDPHVAGGRSGNPVARLWVNTKTKLPVRMEVESFMNSTNGSPTRKKIFYGFEWNVEIDAADFDPNIPDDFEFVPEAEKVQPPIDEQQMVEAFRFFAKLTDGQYPSDLSGRTVYEELNTAWISNYGAPLEKQSRREDIRNTLRLDATVGYYNSLTGQNKDPAYYGHTVTAESPHAVLMRWKMDDGCYKVIFGDLTIAVATPDELAGLEKGLKE